jgi:hypothetical protein
MSRAPRSALGSDQRDIATKRQAVDVDAADAIFLCKKNTRLKNLFDAAWKFNAISGAILRCNHGLLIYS